MGLEAREANLGLTIDAEEAERLDLMLDVFEAMGESDALSGWDGLGLAIQAYSKRTLPLIAWLGDLARRQNRRIPVRLVKGAYWDTEIKRGQEMGLTDYPVFTRKCGTDTSYLACARALLELGDAVYPQFATHNAHTLSAVQVMADGRRDFEYQRLHGMGEMLYELYREVKPPHRVGAGTRIYAPVGTHEDLLAYLVRRLLGKRRQHLLRQSSGRREIADRIHHRRSRRGTACIHAAAQSEYREAGRAYCRTARTPKASSGPIRKSRSLR